LYELQRQGQTAEGLFDRVLQDLGEIPDANRTIARLGLRLDRQGEVIDAARASLVAFCDIIQAVGERAAVDEQGEDFEELLELHEAGQAAGLRFLDAAQRVMAPKRRRR
jgi:hypothetical protein